MWQLLPSPAGQALVLAETDPIRTPLSWMEGRQTYSVLQQAGSHHRCLRTAPSLPQGGHPRQFSLHPFLSGSGAEPSHRQGLWQDWPYTSTQRENVRVVGKAGACLQAALQEGDVKSILGDPVTWKQCWKYSAEPSHRSCMLST